MSAEDLGKRELGCVREQRLDELLTTLRLLRDPLSHSRLGVPALDTLLAGATKPLDPTNLSTIPAPPIIEITSPEPKCGKTALLYHIVASMILKGCDVEKDQSQQTEKATAQITNDTADQPTDAAAQQNYFQPDPPKAIALLLTPGSSISIPHLTTTALTLIKQHHPTLPLASAQHHIHTSLAHIHIFQPLTLSTLIATISSLRPYFLAPQNPSYKRKLGAIILDSATDFLWDDRVATSGGMGSRFPALASVLKAAGVALNTPVLYTTSNISPVTDPVALRPQLPAPWGSLPSLRLVVVRQGKERVGRGVGVKQILQMGKRGSGDGDDGKAEERFRVVVNRWGDEGWVATGHGGGARGFGIRVSGKGVEIT